jgi:hypothetical protein
MDHEPCRLLWGGSKGASMAWRSPTASMPWRRLLLGGVRPTADRPPGLVAAEPALSGLIPAQRPFNHGIRGNTGRKGNRHGHQVSGREAVHQAEHDPLVVARLALGPHPTATRERAPRRPPGAGNHRAGLRRQRRLTTRHPQPAQGATAQPSSFWDAYPKANRGDLNRDSLWPILGQYGMRPIGQASVDEVWSAMRLRTLKEGEAPFTGGR